MTAVAENQPPIPAHAPPVGFIETPTAGKIIFHAEYCRDSGEIGVVIGAPGTGKTAVCRHLRDTHHLPMLSLSPTNGRLRSAAKDVLDALNYGEVSEYEDRNRHHFIERRVRELVEYDFKTILIVDEAQHANPELIDYLRSLSDRSVDAAGHLHLGILLLGNETVLNRMYEDGPKRRKIRPEFAHVVSRFGLRPLELKGPTDGDVIAICKAHGVSDPDKQRFLIDIARGVGGLRAVMKVLTLAFELAGGGLVSLPALHQAAALRGVNGKGESG